jgi:hypothetical protein
MFSGGAGLITLTISYHHRKTLKLCLSYQHHAANPVVVSLSIKAETVSNTNQNLINQKERNAYLMIGRGGRKCLLKNMVTSAIDADNRARTQ